MTDNVSISARPTSSGRVLLAFIIGVILAAAILLAVSRGDVDRMVRSDGRIYRYVAAHLAQAPEDVRSAVAERGSSLRYGRVGLPVMIWAASAGREGAMRYAHPIVIVLAAGFASAAAARLFSQAGSAAAVIPFLAPGFAISIVGGYAELLGAALTLWFLVFAKGDRWVPAVVILAAALLTKETFFLVLAGTGLWLFMRRRFSMIPLLTVVVAPVAIWYAYVASRYGHIPPFDPYLRTTTETLGTPFLGLWDALTSSPARSALLAGMHLLLAIFCLSQWRKGLIGAIAAIAGIGIFASGKFAWAYTAEAGRVFLLLQLFGVLAGIELAARRTWASESRPRQGFDRSSL